MSAIWFIRISIDLAYVVIFPFGCLFIILNGLSEISMDTDLIWYAYIE